MPQYTINNVWIHPPQTYRGKPSLFQIIDCVINKHIKKLEEQTLNLQYRIANEELSIRFQKEELERYHDFRNFVERVLNILITNLIHECDIDFDKSFGLLFQRPRGGGARFISSRDADHFHYYIGVKIRDAFAKKTLLYTVFRDRHILNGLVDSTVSKIEECEEKLKEKKIKLEKMKKELSEHRRFMSDDSR
ncbi:hypothetical protein I9W82_004043 [Candida metapsilosis]|uniref:Uncharacterized protein n=1 Tax=Candida metapsilosis TaxID=273372 RepID=A0A8H7ZFI7_9ASCO|nr:hypothetical protein I9W82_004043 [Candida metapsilosis]